MPFTPEQQQAIDAANARISGGQAAPSAPSSFTPEQQQAIDAANARTAPATAVVAAPISAPAAPKGDRPYRTELQKIAKREGINTVPQASASGIFAGFDDELSAAINAPFHAAYDWYKGKDFDIGRSYTALQQEHDLQKQRRRQEAPISTLAQEIVGGLGTGGALVKAPGAVLAAPGYITAAKTAIAPTVARVTQAAPKTVQYAKVATGGAGYGALSGAGEARPGERLEGAKKGAVVGAVTSVVPQAIGNRIANAFASSAARKATATAGDLAQQGSALYDAAEAEGVRYAAPAVQRLGANIRAVAGRINEHLRPRTAGVVQDAMDKFSGKQSVSFQDFTEFRQELNLAMRGASDTDQRVLLQIKNVVDSWGNKVQGQSRDFTGNAVKAFDLQKQADTLWAQHEKSKILEDIQDNIERKGGGVFTQGGIANAAKNEFESLYKKIQKGQSRGWTKEQVKLIRQMAGGGSASMIIRTLSKFDPKGVISLFGGLALGGPVLTGAGYVAARAREKGMEEGIGRLMQSVTSGKIDAVAPPARNLLPTVTGATAASMEADRRLRELQGR